MKPLYLSLLDVGIGFLQGYLQSLSSHKAAADVTGAIAATIIALQNHKNDVMSRADWESLRA